jgi:hypothetical protein
VKNITVSVPDETYREARIHATANNTSVSALVSKFLAGLSQTESDFEGRKRLQTETIASIRRLQTNRGFRASDRLTREQVHDRNALRR